MQALTVSTWMNYNGLTKKVDSQRKVNYESLSPTSKHILQLINYASPGEALRYLNSIPDTQLYDWSEAFSTLVVENQNKTYETILDFFKDRNSTFGDFIWFSNQFN